MTDNDIATRGSAPVKPPQGGRKIVDRALILTLLGCFLLLPPLAGIFQLDFRVFGIPFTALYLFGVWGLLIGGTAWLSRQLRDDDNSSGAETAAAAEIPEAKQ